MKIGVTERGDAAIDFGWTDKLDTVDGAILITKCINNRFIDTAIEHKDKLIIHATCTGWGGTRIEPNVPSPVEQLCMMDKLIREGFPVEKIVLRIDPIIPTPGGIRLASRIFDLGIEKYGITRYRISVIDLYPHVRERFNKAGIQVPFSGYQATNEQFMRVNALVGEMNEILRNECNLKNRIECCAEPQLTNAVQRGCVSEYDLKLLGLKPNESYLSGLQRRSCLCLSCKTELLANKHKCPNSCLYCYWKD